MSVRLATFCEFRGDEEGFRCQKPGVRLIKAVERKGEPTKVFCDTHFDVVRWCMEEIGEDYETA